MYNLRNLWKNRGVKIHIQNHSFHKKKILQAPSCTRIIAFAVLFAVIHKRTKPSRKGNKKKEKIIKDCIFKSHHNNPIYYHPFRHFLYITYLHIRPIFFPKESVVKGGSGSQARQKGCEDDKKGNITGGLVPPYRIRSSVHESGTVVGVLAFLRSQEWVQRCAVEEGRWVFGANVPLWFPFIRSLHWEAVN